MKSRTMKCALLVGSVALLLSLGSGTVLAHKNKTSTAISFSENPVSAGMPVTITATVTYTGTTGPGSSQGHDSVPPSGTPVVGDTVQIQQLQLNGVGVQCGTLGATFVNIAMGSTNSSGQFSTTFDTTGLGGKKICFRAHHPDSGGAHGNDESMSPAVDLQIDPPPCNSVQIGAERAAGPGNPTPGTYNWTFRITVKNCDLSTRNFKVQGGTSGWTTFLDAVPSEGNYTIRTNNKNEVITWIVELSPGEEQHIDVTVTGTIKPGTPDGTVLYLSGPWSAAYKDDLGNPAKSDYTGRVSITVSNP
jgi:hypothetical protein